VCAQDAHPSMSVRVRGARERAEGARSARAEHGRSTGGARAGSVEHSMPCFVRKVLPYKEVPWELFHLPFRARPVLRCYTPATGYCREG